MKNVALNMKRLISLFEQIFTFPYFVVCTFRFVPTRRKIMLKINECESKRQDSFDVFFCLKYLFKQKR